MCVKVLSCGRDDLQPVTVMLTDASPQSTIPWEGMKNSSVKMFRMMQIHRQSTAASTENAFTTVEDQGTVPWRKGVGAGADKLRPGGHKMAIKTFKSGLQIFMILHQREVSQSIAGFHHRQGKYTMGL